MAIVGYSDVSNLNHRTTAEPSPHAGRDRDGYGRRIPTRYEVQLNGDTKWRRVYVCCISNATTSYVEVATPGKRKKDWHVIEGSLYQKPSDVNRRFIYRVVPSVRLKNPQVCVVVYDRTVDDVSAAARRVKELQERGDVAFAVTHPVEGAYT